MKKIFTFLLTVLAFSATYAQSATTSKAKRIISGDRRDYDPQRNTNDEAKAVIRNRNQNRSIIYDDRTIRRNDNRKYGERSREYGKKRQYPKHRKAYAYNGKAYKYKKKGNNGKHLGWQKGVGNPHRNRRS